MCSRSGENDVYGATLELEEGHMPEDAAGATGLLFALSLAHIPPQAVELSDCERTQALALQVLLSLLKFNHHRTHEMECYNGYSMIHQVLIKSKCIVGYHILKVSLAQAELISKPLFNIQPCQQRCSYCWSVVSHVYSVH